MKIIVIMVVLLTGCATSPAEREQTTYKRLDERARAVDRYEALVRTCRAAGGTVQMDRSWGRFSPTASELQQARCTMRFPRGPR